MKDCLLKERRGCTSSVTNTNNVNIRHLHEIFVKLFARFFPFYFIKDYILSRPLINALLKNMAMNLYNLFCFGNVLAPGRL